MTINLKTIILFLIAASSLLAAKAQVCNGALGDPVVNIDFGKGNTNYGPPISETNYLYVNSTPNDGRYAIVKSTVGTYDSWHQNIVNHTPNDPDGYFMLVNADYTEGVFYEKTIPVCANTTYQFSAYIINVLKTPGIRPDVNFSITYNSTVIQVSTGDIPEGAATDWIRKTLDFKTPAGITSVTLKMTNKNPGGIGNDLGIDDITFRACGPVVTSSINGGSTTRNVCIGETGSYTLKAAVSAGYDNPEFRWQELIGTNWTDIPGENTIQTTRDLSNAAIGTYKYRLSIAEPGNIQSVNCRVASPELTIIVNAKPNAIANNSGPACIGSTVQLNASEGTSYQWTGPNGYTSTEKNPILTNINLATAGTYELIITNAGGCTNPIPATTEVKILPPIMASTNLNAVQICEQESVNLIAAGGTTYQWSPIEGLSDATIANPIASPTQTITYTVKIGNGACEIEKKIAITVLKKPLADAGENKKLLNGQSVVLNGNVSGDYVSYYWSPSTYLDDATKLNPIATPPVSMVYTLNAQSICGIVSANVEVKVYPKIEIPNAFTPNGDGVNDTWNIPAIAAFNTVRLKVVNRYGQIVYQTTKNATWDGKTDGKDVPTGTYYYTLYLNEDFKTYSGWLLLTR